MVERFMHLQGTNVLSEWTNEYKEKIEKSEKYEKIEKFPLVLEILNLILNISNRLPINVADLKNSKIGKKINKLGKCITDKTIKIKCETMVNRWKKMISDMKEEKKNFKSKGLTEEKTEDPASISNLFNILPNNNNPNIINQSKVSFGNMTMSNSLNKRGDYSNNNNTLNNSQLYKKRDRKEFENNYDGNQEDKQLKRPKYDKNNNQHSQNYKYQKDKINNYNKKNLKSILKKQIDDPKFSKKKVKIRWEPEAKIEKIKIFKLTDEPDAPEVSEEEYDKIQQEILKNPHRVFEDMRDMRSREINMEKENINKVREKSNKTKEILYQMIPRLPFTVLYELKLEENDCQLADSSESIEKDEINSIVQKTFAVKYFRVILIF